MIDNNIAQTDIAQTEVLAVDWHANRVGTLIPVVHIRPVVISGITIQRVSGQNARYIADNCIGIGSIVKIVRSGSVPSIYEVVSPASSA